MSSYGSEFVKLGSVRAGEVHCRIQQLSLGIRRKMHNLLSASMAILHTDEAKPPSLRKPIKAAKCRNPSHMGLMYIMYCMHQLDSPPWGLCNLCHPFIHGLLRCPHLRGDTHTLHRRHCQGHDSFRLVDDLMTVHHLLLVISCSPRGCYSFSFYAQIQTPWQECDSTTQAFQVLCSRSFDDIVR